MALEEIPFRIHNGSMNVTLKEFPDDLHATLKEIAQKHGRSLNREIIHTLERAIQPQLTDETTLLQRIKANREQTSAFLNQDFLAEAISEGRS